MKGLLIAEKPSVMRAVQDVYKTLPPGTDTLDFAAFHGHLMRLKLPEEFNPDWKKWDAAALPLFPQFAYLAADKKSADDLYYKVKNGGYDFVVNACDAGREGEHIFWSWYETYGLTVPVKRYWASSNTKPAIKAALGNLYPAARFDGMRQAAKLRAELDWLVGINFSRAASISTDTKASIGRVMSPIRKILVDRELEIRNFVPEDFWELKATGVVNGAEFEMIRLLPPDHKNTRHKTEAEATACKDALKPSGEVLKMKKTPKEINAPTLFSLTELQRSANKAYKMTPSKVLEIAQKLYEEGFLTYPRTNSRFLPTDMIPEVGDHLKAVYCVPDIGPYAQKVTQADITRATTGKTYVDDAKIEDHHAIIPTEQPVNWGALSADEQKVYKLVARQFVAIFMPPFRGESTAVLIRNGSAIFRADGMVELDKGYTVLAESAAKKKDTSLPPMAEGDTVDFKKAVIKKGSTKAPLRYTPDSLLNALVNAGEFVSDAKQRSVLREAAGIGTEATRAGILDKMLAAGDMTLEKNQYIPSEFSIAFIKTYGDRAFCSPAMTAEWEEKLRAMESEKGYPGDLKQEIHKYVKDEVDYLLSEQGEQLRANKWAYVGDCPVCGARVLSFPNTFSCENRKNESNPCSFIFSKQVSGATITESDAKTLLSGKVVSGKSFKRKDGTTFQSGLILGEDGKLNFFRGQESVGQCPVCGGEVYNGKDFFYCSRKTDGCTFVMRKQIKGATLSAKDMSNLLAGKKTRKLTFTWSNGNKGEAALRMKEQGKLEWIFDK